VPDEGTPISGMVRHPEDIRFSLSLYGMTGAARMPCISWHERCRAGRVLHSVCGRARDAGAIGGQRFRDHQEARRLVSPAGVLVPRISGAKIRRLDVSRFLALCLLFLLIACGREPVTIPGSSARPTKPGSGPQPDHVTGGAREAHAGRLASSCRPRLSELAITFRYVFPVQPADAASYAREHHDYPATDIVSWRVGGQRSPAAEVASWAATHL
jgi:hypothetical protein